MSTIIFLMWIKLMNTISHGNAIINFADDMRETKLRPQKQLYFLNFDHAAFQQSTTGWTDLPAEINACTRAHGIYIIQQGEVGRKGKKNKDCGYFCNKLELRTAHYTQYILWFCTSTTTLKRWLFFFSTSCMPGAPLYANG